MTNLTEQDYRDADHSGDAHVDRGPAIAPGVYPDQVFGHALVTDGQRSVVLLDLGGVVTIAGIAIDPAGLRLLGEHLLFLAQRKGATEATTGAAA